MVISFRCKTQISNIMYSTKTAKTNTLKDILLMLDDYDIFSYYLGNFQVGKLYNSPLRSDDKNPSFAVFHSNKNNCLLFKDHGSGQFGNALTFVKTINHITNDEDLEKELLRIVRRKNPTRKVLTQNREYENHDTVIQIARQPFTITDIQYWDKYHISTNTLNKFNVFSIKYFLCNGTVRGVYKETSPMYAYKVFDKFNPRATKRILILLFIATALLKIEDILTMIPFSAIITIMTIGVVILSKNEVYANELSLRYGKLWIFLQILLFTLVGMQIDIKIVLSTGLLGFLIIFIGLLGRSIGVILCLLKSDLNFKERLFVVISYIPKATVQAAIGSMPLNAMLTNDLPILPGQIILSIAVLSILITAPLGSFLIYYSRDRLLTRDIK